MTLLAAEPGSMSRRIASRRLPRISPWIWRWFGKYCDGYLARHMHCVRVAGGGNNSLPAGPCVVFLNHPGWWDPLLCLFLARRYFPDRRHFGPIDAVMLRRYKLLGRLGFFGVEQGTRAGAVNFLAIGNTILQQPDAVLWVTAEGHFSDPRRRPIQLAPGLAHLLRHNRGVTAIPLALEYAFWEERTPEVLARFGRRLTMPDDIRLSTSDVTARLEEGLARTMDDLSRDVIARNAAAFDVALRGGAGVGGIYDRWRRLIALFRGKPFRAEHGEL